MTMASPNVPQYQNIPAELQARKQWVMYRLVPQDDGKTTKIPYHPGGYRASTTNPDDWSNFGTCVAALSRFDGLGFVFCADDPYTGIDLDDALGDEAISQEQLSIFNTIQSYTETSPSGRGCHIIVKGVSPASKRVGKIEMYSQERFFTVTGNVIADRFHITDGQYYVDALYQHLCAKRPERAAKGHQYDEPITLEDAEIITKARAASNGDRFSGLYDGAIAGVINYATGRSHAEDPSGADLALITMLAYYTRNRMQTKRIFMASALAQRSKSQSRDRGYVDRTIDYAFDTMPAPVDTDAIRVALERQMAAFMPLTGVPALPDYTPSPDSPFTPPPGLVGEIAAYIYASSPRPVAEVALGGALALMAGICGNAYNIDRAGLNIYLMVVADTGTGKESMTSGISRLMHAIEAGNSAVKAFVGPSTLASAPGLMRQLSKTSSFVSMQGEFAYRLAAMTGDRANANERTLMGELLALYGKSGHGQATSGAAYSKDDDNIKGVKSPALSLLCDSEPTVLYGVLNDRLISSGLLPRFMLFEYKGLIPPYNEDHFRVEIPDTLKNNLLTLTTRVLQYQMYDRVEDVEYESGAREIMNNFRDWATDTGNALPKGDVAKHMWTRVHVKAMKLASLVAVGVNCTRPRISTDMVEWAINIVKHETYELISKFASGRTGEAVNGTEEDKQVKAVCAAIYAQLTQPFAKVKGYRVREHEYDAKLISYSYLMSRCHKSAAFTQAKFPDTKKNLVRALDMLIAQEILKPADATPPERGFPPKLYGVVDFEAVAKIAQ